MRRSFDEMVKRSSRRPSNPVIPAMAVKKIFFAIKMPINMNDNHIPIPPPRGVGRRCELRSLGLSTRESLLPYLEIKAEQTALRVKEKKNIIRPSRNDIFDTSSRKHSGLQGSSFLYLSFKLRPNHS
jgi:hypothetical protein